MHHGPEELAEDLNYGRDDRCRLASNLFVGTWATRSPATASRLGACGLGRVAGSHPRPIIYLDCSYPSVTPTALPLASSLTGP
jgi:hypothetical protein